MTPHNNSAGILKSENSDGPTSSVGKNRFMTAVMATILLAFPLPVTASEDRANIEVSNGSIATSQLGEKTSEIKESPTCESSTAVTEPFGILRPSSNTPTTSNDGGRERGKLWTSNTFSSVASCSCTGVCYPTCRITSCDGSPTCCLGCQATGCYFNCPPTGGDD